MFPPICSPQDNHLTLSRAYCFFCASLTRLHSLLPSQSVSAVTSCFLTSTEKIKQQPSVQEIVLCYQIHDKEPSYTVKDYQQPSPSFLAKKLTPYKPERRCYTLNSARQLTFVMPTSLGDFSSSYFLPCPGKARIPGLRRQETITFTQEELKLLSA